MTTNELALACASHICSLQHRAGDVLSRDEIEDVIRGCVERAVEEAVARERAACAAYLRGLGYGYFTDQAAGVIERGEHESAYAGAVS